MEAALSLPDDDRAALVEALLDSLSPNDEVTDDGALAAEMEARWADFEHSAEGTLSWDELKNQRVSATTRESSDLRLADKCNHLGVTP
jgi:putative addiction module component (TIGR02574 family)